jgi:hypothetical protein
LARQTLEVGCKYVFAVGGRIAIEHATGKSRDAFFERKIRGASSGEQPLTVSMAVFAGGLILARRRIVVTGTSDNE